MPEYIDREALMVALCEEIVGDGDYYSGKDAMQDQIRDMVSQFPQADVAPVRHGRWFWDDEAYLRCSECTQKAPVTQPYEDEPMSQATNYCPYCGAKMEKEF